MHWMPASQLAKQIHRLQGNIVKAPAAATAPHLDVQMEDLVAVDGLCCCSQL